MGAILKFEEIEARVRNAESQFSELARIHGAVNFAAEASFALALLRDNEFLYKTAAQNPDSLHRAVINVAAIGLTLNPAFKLAYLVPRDGKVNLDISYRGFIHLATDAGAIKWAKAELVYKTDKFQYRGVNQEPLHVFDPFVDGRGPVVGGYSLAKTHDGEFLVDSMTVQQILSIRDRSVAFIAYKAGRIKSTPWSTDETEMMKKTLIRRGYKTWPSTDSRRRVEQAVAISSEVDGAIDTSTQLVEGKVNQAVVVIRSLLEELGRTESQYLTHMKLLCKRDLSSLEDLSEQEIATAVMTLTGMANSKRNKGTPNENAG